MNIYILKLQVIILNLSIIFRPEFPQGAFESSA